MKDPMILIVDDEPEVRALLAAASARAVPEARIVQSASGEDALTALKDTPYGSHLLVISDYRLGPGRMDGITFLTRVEAERPDAARVLITGCDRTEVEARLEDARLDALLQKPVPVQDLVHLVRALATDTPSQA